MPTNPLRFAPIGLLVLFLASAANGSELRRDPPAQRPASTDLRESHETREAARKRAAHPEREARERHACRDARSVKTCEHDHD